MPVNDALGTRMKENYEDVFKTRLMKRTPVAIRIDGKAFHTFTKGFEKPFDEVLSASMQDTMKYLCENIQGCVLGYTQSDEITLILVDYKKLDSSAWFDYEIQKLCSVSASMATMAFNRAFSRRVQQASDGWMYGNRYSQWPDEEAQSYIQNLFLKQRGGAMFDARCFNIPKEEVTNLIYWRQLDAARNSVQMVGQANFSHSELQEKRCNEIQDMLLTQKNINWNDYPTKFKRGSCCVKQEKGWIIDNEIPIFKGEGREYVEKLIQPEE